MPDYYKILELEDGASQQDIKRAYFRLIRQHTPDSDPEGFMKIREAYEQLKAGNTGNQGPSFPVNPDPIAAAVREHMENALSGKDMEKVFELAQFGANHFPSDPYFLYYLQIAQRRLGFTGKAVKTGEKLLRTDVLNPWYNRELTISYLERGYIKKAISQFKRTWALNVRDTELVSMMVSLAEDKDYVNFAVNILMEYLKEKKEWKRDELDDASFLYATLMNHTDIMYPRSADQAFEMSLSFAEKYYPQLEGFLKDLFLMSMVSSAAQSSASQEIIDKVLDYVKNNSSGLPAEMVRTIQNFSETKDISRLMEDGNVAEEVTDFILTEESDFDDHTIYEYARLSCMLILMKQADRYRDDIHYIKRHYPDVYQKEKDFYDLFDDQNKLGQKMDEYRVKFRRLSAECQGSQFYVLFPDEKNRSLPLAAFRQFADPGKRKYGRALVGRNDPCPCGSGKKFKKCCMGKGIFD